MIDRATDAAGTALSGRKRRQLSRLRTQHRRAKFDSTADRNLATACREIARITSALGLAAPIRETTSTVFRDAQFADLLRDRSIGAIAAGSVYAARRIHGQIRPIEEIATVAAGDRDTVLLGYGVLNAELGVAARPVTPGDVHPRLCDAVGVADAVRRRAAPGGGARRHGAGCRDR